MADRRAGPADQRPRRADAGPARHHSAAGRPELWPQGLWPGPDGRGAHRRAGRPWPRRPARRLGRDGAYHRSTIPTHLAARPTSCARWTGWCRPAPAIRRFPADPRCACRARAAWRAAPAQLADGVALHPRIAPMLEPLCAKYGIPFPPPCRAPAHRAREAGKIAACPSPSPSSRNSSRAPTWWRSSGAMCSSRRPAPTFPGLCPFHGEKSPSFSVSPTKQFYHCFGCGKNGNAISFLMDHAGMSFVEAVKDLAGQYGMQVPEDDVSPQQRARAEQREKQNTLTDVLEKAGEAYRKHLKDAPRAIDYCKGRGLSGDIARQFGLGYAPEGWRSLASVFPNYDDPLLVESGLVILNQDEDADEEKRYDRFRDRVMFPIRNVKGECIGFGGRVLGDDKPKYLNSPETPVFSKGRELYGLFEARSALREHGYVLVTEGYMDVVALAQLGFPNAVATLGTACTAEHVHKLFRFTDAVVFSFDGDAAGRRAARKALDGALPYATDVRSVKFLFLPAEHDPDSFIRAHGQDAFAQCIAARPCR